MITILSKVNDVWVYAGPQYKELNDAIVKHHVKYGQKLIETDYSVLTQVYDEDDNKVEMVIVPPSVLGGDEVPAAELVKADVFTEYASKKTALSDITVNYNSNEFSGSAEDQAKIMVAIAILNEGANGDTLIYFTGDKTRVDFDINDFKAILLLISTEQENILNTGGL